MPYLKHIVFISFFVVFLLGHTSPLQNPNSFDLGMEKYQTGDFVGAESLWTQALHQSPLDPIILYNLGLCLAQQNKLGMALAFLRESQWLMPRHAKTKQAIEFVQAELVARGIRLQESFWSFHQNFLTPYFKVEEVLAFHWLLSLGLLVLIGKFYRTRKLARQKNDPPPRWRIHHGIIILIWMAVSALSAVMSLTTIDPWATVISSGTTAIRSGPMSDSAELAPLHEGALVTINEYHKDWVQIRYGSLPMGWVPRSTLRIVTNEGLR